MLATGRVKVKGSSCVRIDGSSNNTMFMGVKICDKAFHGGQSAQKRPLKSVTTIKKKSPGECGAFHAYKKK